MRDKRNDYKPGKGEMQSVHFKNQRRLELDVDNKKFKSGDHLGFKWIRNHIYWTSKKRGLRYVTNQKKHAARFERRKINNQLCSLKNGMETSI